MSTVLYTTLVGDDEPIAELPADIIAYTYRLNAPGSIRFELSIDHPACDPSIVYPGVHEAVVVRNRQIVWRGPVLTAAETDTKVSFRGEGLMHYLKRMYVTTTLGDGTGWTSPTDQFTIIRALIDHHQTKAGGDFGIDTTATNLSGQTRTVIYYGFEYKNIYEAVVQIGERINGFDFTIDPETRELDMWHPQRGIRNPELVWDERNIRDWQRTIDSTEQASQILAVGEGTGTGMLRVTRQDAGAVIQYGLTQDVLTNKSVNQADTLRDQADLALQPEPVGYETVTVSASVPDVFSYAEGDQGRLVYGSPYEPVSGYRRVVGRDIQFVRGEEQVLLHLEPV